jgi:hypothetical protein
MNSPSNENPWQDDYDADPFGPTDPMGELVRLAHEAMQLPPGVLEPKVAIANVWAKLGWDLPDSLVSDRSRERPEAGSGAMPSEPVSGVSAVASEPPAPVAIPSRPQSRRGIRIAILVAVLVLAVGLVASLVVRMFAVDSPNHGSDVPRLVPEDKVGPDAIAPPPLPRYEFEKSSDDVAQVLGPWKPPPATSALPRVSLTDPGSPYNADLERLSKESLRVYVESSSAHAALQHPPSPFVRVIFSLPGQSRQYRVFVLPSHPRNRPRWSGENFVELRVLYERLGLMVGATTFPACKVEFVYPADLTGDLDARQEALAKGPRDPNWDEWIASWKHIQDDAPSAVRALIERALTQPHGKDQP